MHLFPVIPLFQGHLQHTLPQLIIDLQCTMERTIQSTDGRRLLHLSHLRTLQALGIERGPFYSGHL